MRPFTNTLEGKLLSAILTFYPQNKPCQGNETIGSTGGPRKLPRFPGLVKKRYAQFYPFFNLFYVEIKQYFILKDIKFKRGKRIL